MLNIFWKNDVFFEMDKGHKGKKLKNHTKKIIFLLSVVLLLVIWGISKNTLPQDAYIGKPDYDYGRVIERIPISDYIYPDEIYDNSLILLFVVAFVLFVVRIFYVKRRIKK